MINRTVLLIGISRTGGGLPPLQAVETGLDVMQAWALGQGIPSTGIVRFSDANGKKIRMRELQDWVQEQNDDLLVPDQLIIYFSGHGFHGAAGDFWLLSDAPGNPSEAVSLASTEALARNCSFGHVVLLSDACRVPSNNIQFGYVTGSSLFPNRPPAGPSKPVDQFFASSLGQPALEINDHGNVLSVYTEQLARSLSGLDTPLLEPRDNTSPTPVVVRPWPLKRFLPRAISQRLRALNINQPLVPDAIIASDPEMWLATFPAAPSSPVDPAAARQTEANDTSRQVDLAEIYSVVNRADIPAEPRSNRLQIEGSQIPAPPSDLFQAGLTIALNPEVYEKQLVSRAIEEGVSPSLRVTSPNSSDQVLHSNRNPQIGWHFETECGFVISGSRVVEARSRSKVFVDQPSETEVRVSTQGRIPELTLLKFAGGQGILLPAVPGQIGYVATGPGGTVVSLAYEPSSQRKEWQAFENNSKAIRMLRTFLSSTAAAGDLRLAVLDDTQLAEVQRTMHYGAEQVDLGLLVLLGYICYNSRRINLLNQLSSSSLRQFNFLPMDLAILGILSDADFHLDAQPVLPPFPLLSQGWPLMDASSLSLPRSLSELRRHVLPSSWTSIDAVGCTLLQRYLTEEG